MTSTPDIERLAAELIAQRRGAEPKEKFETFMGVSGTRKGYIVFYKLLWRPRVELDELGLPEVRIEPIEWEPIDLEQRAAVALADCPDQDINSSASSLLYPALLIVWQSHGVIWRGTYGGEFLGWRVGPVHRAVAT